MTDTRPVRVAGRSHLTSTGRSCVTDIVTQRVTSTRRSGVTDAITRRDQGRGVGAN
jgi:hypothetical protein